MRSSQNGNQREFFFHIVAQTTTTTFIKRKVADLVALFGSALVLGSVCCPLPGVYVVFIYVEHTPAGTPRKTELEKQRSCAWGGQGDVFRHAHIVIQPTTRIRREGPSVSKTPGRGRGGERGCHMSGVGGGECVAPHTHTSHARKDRAHDGGTNIGPACLSVCPLAKFL